MAYVITILKPMYSKTGAATSPTGRTYDMEPYSEKAVVTLLEAIETVEAHIDEAQDALGEEKEARAYFDPARDNAMALDEDGGRVELPDGWVAEVEFWGATRAVNWMVENGHDPQTEDFIDAYNSKEA